MVFSSPIFLFGFLPITLILYYSSPRVMKNIMLLLSSLFFYAWGEVFYLGVMICSIVSNYVIGLLIYTSQRKEHKKTSHLYVTFGLFINIGLLITFKYANFIADNINKITSLVEISAINISPIHLPLGISFFTFQAISYIVLHIPLK